MKYNKIEHSNLLKLEQKLKEEGKNLRETSNEDFLKLCNYSLMLSNHLHWNPRLDYYPLIQEVADGSLDFSKFTEKYQAIKSQQKILENNSNLFEVVELEEKLSQDFIYFIEEIESLFDRYSPIPIEVYELSHHDLKQKLKEILIEMKNRYP
jgi:hypothetical protein